MNPIKWYKNLLLKSAQWGYMNRDNVVGFLEKLKYMIQLAINIVGIYMLSIITFSIFKWEFTTILAIIIIFINPLTLLFDHSLELVKELKKQVR